LGVATALPSLVAGGTVTFDIKTLPNLRKEGDTTLNIIDFDVGNIGSLTTLAVDWTASDPANPPHTIKLRAYQVSEDTVVDIGDAARVKPPSEVVSTTATVTTGGGRPLFSPTFSKGVNPTTPPLFPPPRKRSDINKAVANSFPEVQLNVSMKTTTTGTVEIGRANELLEASTKGLPLFFQAEFSDGTSSLSPAFGVLGKNDPPPTWTSEFFTSPDRPFPSDKNKPSSSGGSLTSATSSGSGGLGAGPIAGIVVGALAVLAAAIIAIWFFIRRRRQSDDDDTVGAYRNGRTRTDELMAEKEANAGVDASPHSPYSDDGGQRDSSSLHHVGVGTAVAATAVVGHHKKDLSQSTQAAHDAPRSFTPYSDPYSDHHDRVARSPSTHAASAVAASSVSRGIPESPTHGQANIPGVSAPYAHLVEEGMTEDEIRRLEDEERALDAAIEQSAVKRT